MDARVDILRRTCGFCHRWIRLVLAIDKIRNGLSLLAADGRNVRVADSIGDPRNAAAEYPRPDGRRARLTRSSAVLHILKRLSGVWSLIGRLGSAIPIGLRDPVYSLIARVRHGLLPAPAGLCPVVSPELMKRFAP